MVPPIFPKAMEFRKIIYIEGKCIEDVFYLPCIAGVFKDNGRPIFRLNLDVVSDRAIAVIGDCLCEGYDGKWYCLNKKEQEKLDR